MAHRPLRLTSLLSGLSASLLLSAGLSAEVAQADTLYLPDEAVIEVAVIESVGFSADAPRYSDMLLRPVADAAGDYALPSHCLITADGLLDGDRLRVSARTLTCIATQGSESEIFSGELSASAYDDDGRFGLNACVDAQCSEARLEPSRAFTLQLGGELTLEPQDNPSARINEQRRQAEAAEAP
ncbi:hypothetical protein [Halomonas sp. 328]|uniref:hypothetical protein n=1 Tax=Halomonas sp. 328 TaxID=2776704 RepID=UPI0018A7CEA9|nr:hypothetical protein [Halomonas sp. 328]MBF8221737.1 hypothetical protein [Halomonas sp. 328]